MSCHLNNHVWNLQAIKLLLIIVINFVNGASINHFLLKEDEDHHILVAAVASAMEIIIVKGCAELSTTIDSASTPKLIQMMND